MAGKNTSVFGIYRDRVSVEEAVDTMRAAGFRNTDISVLFPDNQGTKDFAHEKHTKAPEGAAAGAGSGALIGGTLGWLVGIGALAIPGVGPFIAAGPIVSALAGVGAGGALGGLVGALVGLGIPEYEAKRYAGRIKSGGILLSVHCDNSDWVRRAKDMLEQTGAEDISSASEAGADFSESDKPMPRRIKHSDSVLSEDRGSVVSRDEPVVHDRVRDEPVVRREVREEREMRDRSRDRDPDLYRDEPVVHDGVRDEPVVRREVREEREMRDRSRDRDPDLYPDDVVVSDPDREVVGRDPRMDTERRVRHAGSADPLDLDPNDEVIYDEHGRRIDRR